MRKKPPGLTVAWRRHERRWADNLYVYPVVSRRSGGVSVGINLNADKLCNFDCIYCQVDRTAPPTLRKVDLARLSAELDLVLTSANDGSLYRVPPCDALGPAERGIRDIAFSGDGEPTTYPKFREAVQIAADARRGFGLDQTKLVLITDAAYLTRPAVREALRIFDENNGEIWAKLDAGTEEYFRLVDRPNVSLQQVLEGILDAARVRPVVIQSLWLRVRGEPLPPGEITAYCDKLNGLLADGGRLKLLQLYTIARRPAERYAAPLSDPELDAIADVVRARVPVSVEVYYGVEVASPDDSQ